MNFIKEIKVNHLRYLDGVDIKISDSQPLNLMLTGRNGSGKTTLLNAIFDFLKKLAHGDYEDREQIEHNLNLEKRWLEEAKVKGDATKEISHQRQVDSFTKRLNSLWGTLTISFSDMDALYKAISEQKFIVAYYKDFRNPNFVEPKSPIKPDYQLKTIEQNKIEQFLNMLVDYKVQAALARNEGNNEDADNINGWFGDFENILKRLFDDQQLRLEFKYTDYSFTIHTGGKSFKLTEMSAGYRAAMDIIADLVFKMQRQGQVVRAYDMEGIVLIDEVETHLHLELQKQIMPLLTTFFPNIQFIVSTHSPFVLSSLRDSVAFDLENKEAITDLTQYSYSALVEGYFGVKQESSDTDIRLDKLEELSLKRALTPSEEDELQRLMSDFDKMPEAVSPLAKGRFLQLKTKILSKQAKG